MYWINVKSKLPLSEGYYLIYEGGEEVFQMAYFDPRFGWKPYLQNREVNPAYWMKISKPKTLDTYSPEEDHNFKVNEYMGIAEASNFIGTSVNTLRNWERQGKIKTRRNPLNRYRCYRKIDLVNLLKSITNEE